MIWWQRNVKFDLVGLAIACGGLAFAQGCTPMDATTVRRTGTMLLPQPHNVRLSAGQFNLIDGARLLLPDDLEDPEKLALREFQQQCADQLGCVFRAQPQEPRPQEPLPQDPVQSPKSILVRIERVDAASVRQAQGYRLIVTPESVELIGASPVGLFYGIQTLKQLVVIHGNVWPCLDIEDMPDYAVRGLYHDVSRGKVPKLDTLKELVDVLAGHKVNQLQLYVEHPFAFKFNPDIGKGCSPLTPDEIRELDAYCAMRRIDLVPSLASFGHMGFVLSLPEYRHLAEIETTKSWEQMTWHERMKGLTLDPTNPESRALLERMYAEFMPLFSSELVNACCDETYDLGKGKNSALAEKVGAGRLFVDHIEWLRELCRKHGKRLMIWADIVKKHPQIADEVPDDVILLDWGYAADMDYDSPAAFRRAGLTTYVCPGTSGWNRIVNDIDNAELNIRRFAKAGRKRGADGLLNTDWGDYGHVNLLACSWHPIVLGAAMGWNTTAPAPDDFDRRFSLLMFGDPDGVGVAALRSVVGAARGLRTWPAFLAPLDGPDEAPSQSATSLSDEQIRHLRSAALEGQSVFAAYRRQGVGSTRDAAELGTACRLTALLADKILLVRRLAQRGSGPTPQLAGLLERFARDCESVACEYETVWLARNKPSNLHEILAVFGRHADQARKAMAQ